MLLLLSADIFSKLIFKKILSSSLSEGQTVWIQIRTDVQSVLNWVQIVCKDYQQTLFKGTSSKERVTVFSLADFFFYKTRPTDMEV